MQPGDDHGLARTGLAGDDGESRIKFERGLVDHAEALDAHFGQHSAHFIRYGRRKLVSIHMCVRFAEISTEMSTEMSSATAPSLHG
ncbi:hypothetical protein GCM10027436_88930 [Actinophytocola sediminis]